jgi:hypothetical protein
MRIDSLIFKALRMILNLNAKLYGQGASREVLRDLALYCREAR